MRIYFQGYAEGVHLILGILHGLRYPLGSSNVRARISYRMFLGFLARVMGGVSPITAGLTTQVESRLNANSYIWSMLVHSGIQVEEGREFLRWDGGLRLTLPIPEKKILTVVEGVELAECDIGDGYVEVRVEDVGVQVGIMLNWAAINYSLLERRVEMEGHVMNLTFALAAKLYESGGDIAGKLATIDAAIDAALSV